MRGEKEKNDQYQLNKILTEVGGYYPNFGVKEEELIKKAFEYAKTAHKNQLRASGAPYFTHPLKATEILLSIKPDIDTIIACLLHDVIEDTEVTGEEVAKNFGPIIRFLCEGVEKVSRVRIKKTDKSHLFESLQKLFVAVAQDIRVIFIKLADRIHNLETLEFLPPEKRERIAKESLEIYAPVADSLGLFDFRVKIEDLALKHLEPEVYKQIKREIKTYKKEKSKFVEKAKKEIEELFGKENFSILQLAGREKNFMSIYKKLKRKNLTSALELYDIFGFRVIVKNKEDCYKALGILHSQWRPMPGRFKDYIAVPKTNGYQSLHTTLLGIASSHTPIEIQIRTAMMHIDAQFGPAAHWAYKKTGHSHFDQAYLQKTQWFPQSIPTEREKSPQQFFKEISENILTDRMFVFTRTGDIKILPRGSTPVDFAYSVHTEIGNTCVGARVNGIIKPLDYQLRQGDVIEILTRTGRHPNPAWLDFVKSSQAKSHIRHYLNKHQDPIDSLATGFIERKQSPTSPKKKQKKEYTSTLIEQKPLKDFSVIIGGEDNLPYRFAKCCNPKPGQDIIAYNSRGLEFIVYEANAKEVQELDPERLYEAHFVLRKKFRITARDRYGLMRDYTSIIFDRGIFIWDARVSRKTPKIAVNTFTVNVTSTKEFHELLERIKKIPNVISVEEVKPKTKKS